MEIIKYLIGIFVIILLGLVLISLDGLKILGVIFLIWLGSWVGPHIIPYEFPKDSILPKLIFVLYCLVVSYLVMTDKPNSSYQSDEY